MLSAVGAHLWSHACSLTLVVQLCLYGKHFFARQARSALTKPSGASKVAQLPMLNVRCGTEHACTGEILSRKEIRRHESCPRSHHRPRSVFFGARELQFCPCSTVSAPALLPSYLRGPAGRCCKTRVRARGRPRFKIENCY